MCDTLAVLSSHSQNGISYLAKNSDREPDESQLITCAPEQFPDVGMLKCTFIEIPQVEHTNAVILSRPFQMWGAEMGVNEHGLAIGNEAVFTRFKFKKRNDGLTGMDLVRLALERCETALEALQLITELLQTYGQDACGGYRNKNFYYHNSFLIVDRQGGWKLETAGREWVAKPIEGADSISNGLTIDADWTLKSATAISTARQKSWLKSVNGRFAFRKSYSDRLYTYFSRSKARRSATYSCFSTRDGFDRSAAREILKTHHPIEKKFHPRKATAGSICMHATGLLNPSSSTGSMIAEIDKDGKAIVWLTCTAYPCLSVYIPFYFDGIDKIDRLNDFLDPKNADEGIWWQHQNLYLKLVANYNHSKDAIEGELRAFQKEIDAQCKAAEEGKLEDTLFWLEKYKLLIHKLTLELAV